MLHKDAVSFRTASPDIRILCTLLCKVKQTHPENAPDLVISADTIVLLPSTSPAFPAKILEKPNTKSNNMSMLEDQNGNLVKCITGITVIFPGLVSPGYIVK